jgi:hypothetical protein
VEAESIVKRQSEPLDIGASSGRLWNEDVVADVQRDAPADDQVFQQRLQ